MSVLVFSDRCKHCVSIIQYVQQHPALQSMVKFHNIDKGVPKRVERVPTLVTSDGKMLVGGEVKAWLESMLPSSFTEYESSCIGMSCLDNTDDDNGFFKLDMYGQSLKPTISRELEDRMNKSIDEAMTELKN